MDATFNNILKSWDASSIAFLIVYGIIRGCFVRRTGLPFWLGFIWALPVIGFFFKIWLAHTDWPGTKSKSKPRAAPKTTKRRKRSSGRRVTA